MDMTAATISKSRNGETNCSKTTESILFFFLCVNMFLPSFDLSSASAVVKPLISIAILLFGFLYDYLLKAVSFLRHACIRHIRFSGHFASSVGEETYFTPSLCPLHAHLEKVRRRLDHWTRFDPGSVAERVHVRAVAPILAVIRALLLKQSVSSNVRYPVSRFVLCFEKRRDASAASKKNQCAQLYVPGR